MYRTCQDLEHTKAPRKRLREGVSDEEGEKGNNYGDGSLPQDGVLLMYKADALVQLGRPVKALECLDRWENRTREIMI